MTLNKKNQDSSPHLFQGIHILGEIYGCPTHLLDDVAYLEKLLKDGIQKSGATLCSIQSKKFEPTGVTILALLSESHASIHTYPQEGALFFDAFTCGTSCEPEEISRVLYEGLEAQEHSLQRVMRGAGAEMEESSSSDEEGHHGHHHHGDECCHHNH